MYRRSHEIKPSFMTQESNHSGAGSILNIFETTETPTRTSNFPLSKKNSMCDSSQNGRESS